MMSKMGISTAEAYCAAQIFEAVGLHQDLVDRCFTGTPSRIGGLRFGELARDVLIWHANAYPVDDGRRTTRRRDYARRPTSVVHRQTGSSRFLQRARRRRSARLFAARGARLAEGGAHRGHHRVHRRTRGPRRHRHDPHAIVRDRPPVRRGLPHLSRRVRRSLPLARAADRAARPAGDQERPRADSRRGGRADRGHRQALLERGHVAGGAVARGARERWPSP